MLPAHAEWAGQSHRHLRDPDEVLTIALGQMRVKGIPDDMLQLYLARLFDQSLPLPDDFGIVVILIVAGNVTLLPAVGANRILHLEPKMAEGARLEIQGDFMVSDWQLRLAGLYCQNRAERKGDRMCRAHVGRGERPSIREIEPHMLEGERPAVDSDRANAHQFSVAQPVLDRKLRAGAGIL